MNWVMSLGFVTSKIALVWHLMNARARAWSQNAQTRFVLTMDKGRFGHNHCRLGLEKHLHAKALGILILTLSCCIKTLSMKKQLDCAQQLPQYFRRAISRA